MSKDEQETLEDYLELERYIEHLSLQRSARPPANLALEQRPIYSMAIFFHVASPRVADPRPEFKAQLCQQLLRQIRTESMESGQDLLRPSPATTVTTSTQSQRQFRRIYSNKAPSQSAQIPASHPERADAKKHKLRDMWKGVASVPRRTLFRNGTIAASLLASAGIGAAIGHVLEQPKAEQKSTLPGDTWQFVASLGELGNEPIRFTTNTITGYVIRQVVDVNDSIVTNAAHIGNSPNERIVALSAACTHLGCLVQWQNNGQQFICPCHGRTFDTEGGPTRTEAYQPPYVPLPRLETKIEHGNIYVRIP